ncbi:SCO-spondin-like [Oppia nitens]|uniref:SCO-spondin-like n=1 Tax=Oppia nitens TaxID=1686743 RepID=UPI0023DB4310|nr:SCO-spondin-like [Oppia nitens]
MMNKLVLIATFIFIVNVVYIESFIPGAIRHNCDPVKQEYQQCGTMCPDTCQDVVSSGIKACVLSCRSGCFCKEPYVLDKKDGQCVNKSTCLVESQPTLDINILGPIRQDCDPMKQEFLECGTRCPDTCEDILSPGFKACPLICESGCFCKEPYVLDKKGGQCVNRSTCLVESQQTLDIISISTQCDPVKQVYRQCASTCPMTCERLRKNIPAICPLNCMSGCDCKEPYVLEYEGGQCVNRSTCFVESQQK